MENIKTPAGFLGLIQQTESTNITIEDFEKLKQVLKSEIVVSAQELIHFYPLFDTKEKFEKLMKLISEKPDGVILKVKNSLGNYEGKEISRKLMNGDNEYSYCPYCMERLRRGGDSQEFKKELRPMWLVTYKTVVQTSGFNAVIDYYTQCECELCRRKVTEEDFLNCRAKGKASAPKTINLKNVNIYDAKFFENF